MVDCEKLNRGVIEENKEEMQKNVTVNTSDKK